MQRNPREATISQRVALGGARNCCSRTSRYDGVGLGFGAEEQPARAGPQMRRAGDSLAARAEFSGRVVRDRAIAPWYYYVCGGGQVGVQCLGRPGQ